MTLPAPEAERSIWKAHAVKVERRRSVVMGRVSWVIAIALAVWLLALVI
jgi:hypothetical protein